MECCEAIVHYPVCNINIYYIIEVVFLAATGSSRKPQLSRTNYQGTGALKVGSKKTNASRNNSKLFTQSKKHPSSSTISPASTSSTLISTPSPRKSARSLALSRSPKIVNITPLKSTLKYPGIDYLFFISMVLWVKIISKL